MRPEDKELQTELLELIRTRMPKHRSLAAAIGDALNISQDAAYRRIRGDTSLTIQETQSLCRTFGISLDRLMLDQTNAIQFRSVVHLGNREMQARIAGLSRSVERFLPYPEADVCFLSMEFPIYHLLQIPELARFKMNYWRSLMQDEDHSQEIHLASSLDDLPELRRMLDLAFRIPSTEVVSETAWNTTLKQILFFLESGRFADPEDALLLLDKLDELSVHLKRQAATGVKMQMQGIADAGDTGEGRGNKLEGGKDSGPSFHLFYNEMIFSQTLIYLSANGDEEVLLEHNLLDFISTTDPEFCGYTRQTLDRIMKKSIPISHVAERERHKFFWALEKRIAETRKKVLNLV